MRTHLIGATALLMSLGGIAAAPAAAPTAPHITPTVVLHKQADVIKASVPDAQQFFLRTVKIGQRDFRTIKQEAGFEPKEDAVKFYYGKAGDGSVAGVVLFPQITTQHGPMEIGLTMNPDGTVRQVTITKATVEMKPWVQSAVATGFLDKLKGLNASGDPSQALEGLSKASLGSMPYYMAQVAVKDVVRGLAYYRTLYQNASNAG